MIRIIMFDLGGTLIDSGRRPFPQAKDALSTIAKLVAGDGKPVQVCLVSDFTMPEPPVTKAKIDGLFRDYLAILVETGLAGFFDPPARHVTLSSHAGVMKPDRRVFEMALKRLKTRAGLADCLLVTEDAQHVDAVRGLGMEALRFGADFTAWEEAPAIIAERVAPGDAANMEAVVGGFLKSQGLDLIAIKPQVLANCWRAMPLPGFGEVEVPVPVNVSVSRDGRGTLVSAAGEPQADAVREATAYVRSLASRGEIGGPRGTYDIVTGDHGRKRLVRKRMAAK